MNSTLSARAISDPKAVVAVYNTHAEAEAGVRELQKGGFDTKKLSIVGKDYHTEEHVVG
jgi:heat induced stress protein YflT